MKKLKDRLTHKQKQILRKQEKDTLTAEKWIKDTGLNACAFVKLPVQVQKAQQAAHSLLTYNINFLTTEQVQILRAFQRKVGNTKNHKSLKPSTAFPILNISNKINRLLFKQNKQLSKTNIAATTI